MTTLSFVTHIMEARAALGFLARGCSDAHLAWLLNKLRRGKEASHVPYVAMGDRDGGPIASVSAGQVLRQAGAFVLHREPAAGTRDIYEGPVFLGGNGHAIGLAGNELLGTRLVLHDRAGSWQHWVATTRILASRVAHAARLERVIWALYGQAFLKKSKQLERQLGTLSFVRREAEMRLQELGVALQGAAKEGVWRPDMETYREGSLETVDAWDHAMTEFVASFLYTGRLARALTQGYLESTMVPGPGCPGCDAPTTTVQWTDLTGVGQDLTSIECLRCGDIEIWPAQGHRVSITGARSLVGGQSLSLDYRMSDTTSPFGNGYLSVSVFDSTDDVPYARHTEKLLGATGSIRIDVPSNVRAHTQTIRAVICQGMLVSTWRALVPAFPSVEDTGRR